MSAPTRKYMIRLPIDGQSQQAAPIMAGYGEIIKELRKQATTDVVKYSMPSATDDVLRRLVNIAKAPKADLIAKGVDVDDLPDLADVLATNLPWVGHVTHNDASRQFRSKNVLAVAVEVLREFDGYVYRLSADVGQIPESRGPALFELQSPSRMDRYYKIYVNLEIADKLSSDILLKSPIVPQKLIDYLEKLGYKQQGRFFTHDGGWRGVNIHVSLFGMIADAGAV